MRASLVVARGERRVAEAVPPDGSPLETGTPAERRAAMRVLLDAVNPTMDDRSLRRELDRTRPAVVLSMAAHHGVSGFVFNRLAPLADGSALVDELRARYRADVRRHLLVAAKAAGLAGLFGNEISWAVVKGPALIRQLYGDRAGLRTYADLDLLVHPAHFRRAIGILEEADVRLRDRNWRMLRRDMRGEVLFEMPDQVPLDLHWNLVNMYRYRVRVDTAEILARAPTIRIGSVDVPTLGPEDTILHLAVHGALSGGDRLLWLKDLERAAATWRLDWSLVVERAVRWRVRRAAGLMLQRSVDVLNAEVPSDVLARLLPRTERAIVRTVDRWSPWEFGFARTAAPTRLVSRAIVHGVVGGAAWIAWRSLRNLDPRQEWLASAFRPTGDASDWDAFVDAVVALGAPPVQRA